jgi:ABC-type polysaccharide/polyol phosphate transport system ATPase subunit
MTADIALQVNNLGKCYHIYTKPQDRLKQMFLGKFKQFYQEFWALRDVSFTVKKGEPLGVIGCNGAGKSTLLQLICKTLTPTTGQVKVNGQVAALLELGAGFNPEFTGRENVFMACSVLGFSRQQTQELFTRIVAFADIGDFIEQPVKIYSSGMYVRLAFAVQACIKPDILIVDEALAVGDVFFQQKCYAKLHKMIDAGMTCIFVSHDTSAVLNICKRAVLLKNGSIDFYGDVEEAVSRYFAQVGSKIAIDVKQQENIKVTDKIVNQEDEITTAILQNNILQSTKKHGAGGLEIVAARVFNSQGQDTFHVNMLDTLRIHLLLQAREHVQSPSASIHLYDRFNNLIFASGTRQLGYILRDLRPGEQVLVEFGLQFAVQAGEYTFSLGAAEPSRESPNIGYIHAKHEDLGPITVHADTTQILPFYGVAKLPLQISILSS